MGRQGGRRASKRQSWSRKRKAEERGAKSARKRDDHGQNGYAVIHNSNPRLEAYYSLVGLHDARYDEERKEFVTCVNDEEKHAERGHLMSALSRILPASFRVGRSLDPMIQRTLLDDLGELAGREMELEVELPRKSAAFGGIRNILERGSDGDGNKSHVEEDGGVNVNSKKDVTKQDISAMSVGGDDVSAKRAGGNDNDKDIVNDKNICVVNGPAIVKRTIPPAKPIPFIKASNDSETILGYQLSVDRRTIRRNKSLQPLFEWLKLHSDAGHVTRQETVSMIPPVVLDVREGMSVLDMCAAPGSKTCQLLEVVGGMPSKKCAGKKEGEGGKAQEEGKVKGGLEPRGYVVANDADPKRAYMLVNQLRRMNSPSVFVTSCDGQYFPILDDKSARGTDKEGTFDRVLCDVPCSGDGTIRKNPGIWKNWNQMGSLSLHPLQFSISLRGARLTKVGGCMVYSTCSMNPIENEAVVAELLRVTDGSLVLEDPRGRMEGLIARPGWSSWRVLREGRNITRKAQKDWKNKNNDKMKAKRKEWEERRAKGECPSPKELQEKVTGDEELKKKDVKFVPSPFNTIPYVPPATWDHATLNERATSLGFVAYSSYDDVELEWRRRVRASCFPPMEEEAARFGLHKCLRCLPQDMDTGGFFVALLKKVKPLEKDITERMNANARESRGGVEGDARQSKEGGGGVEKKGANGEEGSKLSVAEGKADAGPDNVTKGEVRNPTEEEKEPIQNASAHKTGIQYKQKKKQDLGKEDFIPIDSSIWPSIVKEYGLTPTFPKDQFMVRASGEAKVLYFISKSIKEELIDCGIQDHVTVINSGLKAFERCSLRENERVAYRLAQEGIQYVVQHVTKRILTVDMDDFYACLKEGFISFDKFSESFRKGLEELEPGCFIVKLKEYEDDISMKMFLSMWRRMNKAVNCFVSKVEMDTILSKMRALGYVAKDDDEEEEVADKSAVEKPTDYDKEKANVP